jgi:hypothetical protein
MSMERLMTTLPGHLLSRPAQRARAGSLGTLQQLDCEDLEPATCDALTQEQKRLQLRTDAATFCLHQQFLRAHGLPKGELTTLMTTPITTAITTAITPPMATATISANAGGAFLSGAEHHK